MTESEWTEGNRFRLLENGEAFFPYVNALIAAAQHEVLVDTFILFEDEVGLALKQALLTAARRGASVQVVVDGYGSLDLSEAFIAELIAAGVKFSMFDPKPRVLSVRTNPFRRLHRKTVVVDQHEAVVGGINFSEEHLRRYGARSKQDYAVAVQGPVVGSIRAFYLDCHQPPRRSSWWPRSSRRHRPFATAIGDEGGAMLLVRDNHRHPDDIEYAYRLGIRSASQRIVLANAYFLPGYRLIRDLCKAARRGVRVQLILQGQPDMPIVRAATTMLHGILLRAGVQIYEYVERPLHAKVAVIDDSWCTVGSSNLDPLSLYLNLESNLVLRDRRFTAELAANLLALIDTHCHAVPLPRAWTPVWLRRLLTAGLFHLLRHLPGLLGHVPRRPSVR